MSNYAIIAAAGNGERINSLHSKMLLRIMEKPVLAYTIDQFEQSEKIDKIILTIRLQDHQLIEKEILQKYNYKKIFMIVSGGLTRQESVHHGLKAIKEDDGIVCIHDGARPLVKKWMIDETIDCTNHYEGAIMAIPATETIKKIFLENMTVEKTINRDKCWIIQTPQSFKLKYIRSLYQKALNDRLTVTDDSSIVEHYGGTVKIITGSEDNIKITTKVDMALAEILIKKSCE